MEKKTEKEEKKCERNGRLKKRLYIKNPKKMNFGKRPLR